MKTLLALLCSLVVVTPVFPQVGDPTTPAQESTPAQKAKMKGAQKAAAKSEEAAKKEEPKIEGVVVPRGEKGFLGVQIVNGGFKISFYDTKKKPVAADVSRAVLRWDPKYKVGQERLVLNPDGSGTALAAPKVIRPPYNFKLFITLLKEATEKEDAVGETHVIDFRA